MSGANVRGRSPEHRAAPLSKNVADSPFQVNAQVDDTYCMYKWTSWMHLYHGDVSPAS
jgi:hypothetical protein